MHFLPAPGRQDRAFRQGAAYLLAPHTSLLLHALLLLVKKNALGASDQDQLDHNHSMRTRYATHDMGDPVCAWATQSHLFANSTHVPW